MTLQQLKVLRTLVTLGGEAPMIKVINESKLKTPSVSASLVRMRDRGYVTKKDVSGLWVITEAGKTVLEEASDSLKESA